jgi:sigma-B regulation protein RsbU (phosphoserine phosphatase)
MRQAAVRGKISIAPFPDSDLHLSVSTLIGKPEEVNHLIVVGLYRASDLYTAFMKTNIYHHFLLDKSGQKVLGPQSDLLSQLAIQDILKSTLPEGALDIKGDKPLIVSYADAGVADMKVAAIVERADALTAVNVLMLQSLLFFVALIAITVIISVIASIKLTAALRNLFDATKLIAKGQFDVRVKKDSNDEVGGLADGFNFMAGEVSRLMIEASTKARMAGELETVKIVQETLFPASTSQFGPYRVTGHIEAASECGGDWWNYNQVGDKLFLWIGDATGHGAPAAMVTSAAKSAATIIEDLEYMTPGKALEIMNKAIHETAKGKILMTFFIAAIDMKTGEMAYANASHEPPYIIRARSDGGKITKKDLEPLIEANGPRLGDRRSAKYVEERVQLKPGDTILFYTDGIVDLKSPDGKVWGERGFVKSICESAMAGKTADHKIEKLKTNISQFRQNTELIDDITLFVCQYGEVA